MLANWTLPCYDGSKTDSTLLHDYKGKIVMLDFWIKKCGYCVASFPGLNRLQQELGLGMFQILSINVEDEKEDLYFFYNKYNPAYKMIFKGEQLARDYGLSAYPTIVLLDKTGKIIYISNNGFDPDEIKKIVKEHI